MTADAHAPHDTTGGAAAPAQANLATAADTPTAGAPATDPGPARFRQHTDGRVVLYDPTDVLPPRGHTKPWRRVLPEPTWGIDVGGPHRLTDAEVHGEGWSGAVLVALPEPEVTSLLCGCGQAPDGAPGYGGGCSPGCMEPEEVSFGGVVDLVIGDPEGGIYVPDGLYPDEACGPDDVREVAAALLAAALYQETHALTADPDPIPAEVTS